MGKLTKPEFDKVPNGMTISMDLSQYDKKKTATNEKTTLGQKLTETMSAKKVLKTKSVKSLG